MRMPWKQERSSPEEKIFRSVPLHLISPNPYQPRTLFDPDALQELADSIRTYGVISPLTVRCLGEGYQLIAGERRLRAAKMAGLAAVPCYILPADDRESSLLALLENLQRRDLDCFEEALSLRQLCEQFHMTQQEAALRIGKTQSAVANKLRLLRLSQPVVDLIRQYGLTERHARTLLQLPDEQAQSAAALAMGQRQMNVAQAEEYVARLLSAKPRHKRMILLRDVRLFSNTVDRAVRMMRDAGQAVDYCRTREGKDLLFSVRVVDACEGGEDVSRETEKSAL